MKLVIDTNVLLDWLVFQNPDVQPLITALQAHHAKWLATQPMLEELDRVLRYPLMLAWKPDWGMIEDLIKTYVCLCPVPKETAPALCADPDDQKYLDLAWTEQASRLLSKDKLLIKAARRCQLQTSTYL